MNERIKELKKQAGDYASKQTNVAEEWQWIHDKKFAELIVKECVVFLKDTLDDHFAAEQLEEHFGVEE